MQTKFDSSNLRELLDRKGVLSADEALSWVSTIITLLEQVHRSTGQPYIRLQPQNILISKGTGISLAYLDKIALDKKQEYYCSEQSTDILALGKVFFEMLTKKALGVVPLSWREKYAQLKLLKNTPQLQEFCWKMITRPIFRFSTLSEVKQYLVSLEAPYTKYCFTLWFACQEWFYTDFAKLCEESRQSKIREKLTHFFKTSPQQKLDATFKKEWRSQIIQQILQMIAILEEEEVCTLARGLTTFPDKFCLEKIISQLSIQDSNSKEFFITFYRHTPKKYWKNKILRKIEYVLSNDDPKGTATLSLWLEIFSGEELVRQILQGIADPQKTNIYLQLLKNPDVIGRFRNLPENLWKSSITELWEMSQRKKRLIHFSAIKLLRWIALGENEHSHASYLRQETHRIQNKLWSFVANNLSSISDEKISLWIKENVTIQENPLNLAKTQLYQPAHILTKTQFYPTTEESPRSLTKTQVYSPIQDIAETKTEKKDEDSEEIINEIQQAVEAEIQAEKQGKPSIQADLEAIYDAEDLYDLDKNDSDSDVIQENKPLPPNASEKIAPEIQEESSQPIMINAEQSNPIQSPSKNSIVQQEKHDDIKQNHADIEENHDDMEQDFQELNEVETNIPSFNKNIILPSEKSIFCDVPKTMEILNVNEEQLMDLILSEQIQAFYGDYETKFVESEIVAFWKTALRNLHGEMKLVKILDILGIELEEPIETNKGSFQTIVAFKRILDEIFTPEQVAKIFCILYDIPFFDLSQFNIDEKLLEKFDRLTGRNQEFIPIREEKDHIIVATTNYTNIIRNADYLTLLLGIPVQFVFVSTVAFTEAQSKYRNIYIQQYERLESMLQEKELKEIEEIEEKIEKKSEVVQPLLPAAFTMESIEDKPHPDIEFGLDELFAEGEGEAAVGVEEVEDVTTEEEDEKLTLQEISLESPTEKIQVEQVEQEEIEELGSLDDGGGGVSISKKEEPPEPQPTETTKGKLPKLSEIPEADMILSSYDESDRADYQKKRKPAEPPKLKRKKTSKEIEKTDIDQPPKPSKPPEPWKSDLIRGITLPPVGGTTRTSEIIPTLGKPSSALPKDTSVQRGKKAPIAPGKPAIPPPKTEEMKERGIFFPQPTIPKLPPSSILPTPPIPPPPSLDMPSASMQDRDETDSMMGEATASPLEQIELPPVTAIPPFELPGIEEKKEMPRKADKKEISGTRIERMAPPPKPTKLEPMAPPPAPMATSKPMAPEPMVPPPPPPMAAPKPMAPEPMGYPSPNMAPPDLIRPEPLAKPMPYPTSKRLGAVRRRTSEILSKSDQEKLADTRIEPPIQKEGERRQAEEKKKIQAPSEIEEIEEDKLGRQPTTKDREIADEITPISGKLKRDEQRRQTTQVVSKMPSKAIQIGPKMPTIEPKKFEKALSDEAGKPGPFERIIAQSVLAMKTFQVILGLKFVLFAQMVDIIIQMFTSYISNIYNTWKTMKTIRRAWQRQQSGQLQNELMKDFQKARIQLLRFLHLPGFVLEEQAKNLPDKQEWQKIYQATFPLQLALELRGHFDEIKRDLSLLTPSQTKQFIQKGVTDFLVSLIPNPADFIMPWKDFFILLFCLEYSRPHSKEMYIDFLISYQTILYQLAEKKKAQLQLEKENIQKKHPENQPKKEGNKNPYQPTYQLTRWENALLQSLHQKQEKKSLELAIQDARKSLQRIIVLSCKLDFCLRPRKWTRWELLWDTYQMAESQTEQPLLFLELERWLTQSVAEVLHEKGFELTLEERQLRFQEAKNFQRRYRLSQQIHHALL